MITELFTRRLHLRRMTMKDASALFTIWSDPDVTKFMNITAFNSEKQAIEMITLLNQLAKEQKALRFAIVQRESKELIGSCGFNYFDFENSKTEIGYDIGKTFWGKGYAPEAVYALVNTAFNSLNLNRVEAKVEPENQNSIKVLEKLNFTFEGTLRQSEKPKGKFIDLTIYSKLKSDPK